jgi:hypothetical protein
MKTVFTRASAFVTSGLFAFLFCAGLVVAQTRGIPIPPRPQEGTRDPGANPGRDPNAPPLTEIEEEMRAKHAIKAAEKEHEENLDRAREIGQIGKELQECAKNASSLDRDFLKKVERLEKLARKIRGEAGGEDDEVKLPKRPTDAASAIAQLADASETLSKDVQNTPRQVVSASVIGSANVLLELIKIVRGYTRQL